MSKGCLCTTYGQLSSNPLSKGRSIQQNLTRRHFMTGLCWVNSDLGTFSKQSSRKTRGSRSWWRRNTKRRGPVHLNPPAILQIIKNGIKREKTRRNQRSITIKEGIAPLPPPQKSPLHSPQTLLAMSALASPRVSTRNNSWRRQHSWRVSSKATSPCWWPHTGDREGRGKRWRHRLCTRKMRRRYSQRSISRSRKGKRLL